MEHLGPAADERARGRALRRRRLQVEVLAHAHAAHDAQEGVSEEGAARAAAAGVGPPSAAADGRIDRRNVRSEGPLGAVPPRRHAWV